MKRAILVSGLCGRMGGKVAELIAQAPDLDLAGGIEKEGHPSAGGVLYICKTELRVARGFGDTIPAADLLVDFTCPEATKAALELCLARGMALITGTTGHNDKSIVAMKEASRHIPLLFSPNMSVGISLLARMLSGMIGLLGEDCDIELIEKHHRGKKDSPSGTALSLAETIARSSPGGKKFEIRYGRTPGTLLREGSDIFIHSIRAGDIIGEHTVLMAVKGERIEIKHVAESRDCFAHGTIAAIRFLLGKSAGWYTMEDVVSLRTV